MPFLSHKLRESQHETPTDHGLIVSEGGCIYCIYYISIYPRSAEVVQQTSV